MQISMFPNLDVVLLYIVWKTYRFILQFCLCHAMFWHKLAGLIIDNYNSNRVQP